MPNLDSDIETINSSLREVSSQLKTAARDRDEQSARLQHLEQVAAVASSRGDSYTASGSHVGADAITKLGEDSSFSAAVHAAQRGMKPGAFNARIDLDCSIRAALVTSGTGNTGDTEMPRNTERGGIFGPAFRPLRLLDVLPSRPTTSDSVEIVQLGVTGDASEQIHEGDVKAEMDIAGTPETVNIVTIAGWTSASKQVLADEPALGQQVDRVIRNKVLARLENQIINGPGGQGKINGLLNQASVFTPVIGTTPADMVGEALVTMADAGYLPNLVLLNPLDWFKIQITRKNATDDEYVFGSPTMPVPAALWNTVIVTTPSLAAGTSLVLDTSFTTVLDREQVSVQISNSHADFFVRNLIAILGEMRAGLELADLGAVRKFSIAP